MREVALRHVAFRMDLLKKQEALASKQSVFLTHTVEEPRRPAPMPQPNDSRVIRLTPDMRKDQ